MNTKIIVGSGSGQPIAVRQRPHILGENLKGLGAEHGLSPSRVAQELHITGSAYRKNYLEGRCCPKAFLLGDMADCFETNPCRLLLSEREFRTMMTDLVRSFEIRPGEPEMSDPVWDVLFLNAIPNTIRSRRKAKRLTIKEASKRAGMSTPVWSRSEQEGNFSQTGWWPNIARTLDMTLLELITPEDRIIPIVQRLMRDNDIPFP